MNSAKSSGWQEKKWQENTVTDEFHRKMPDEINFTRGELDYEAGIYCPHS